MQALEPDREVLEQQLAVREPAAPEETRARGAAMVAVGRTRAARIRMLGRAEEAAPGWAGQGRGAKRAAVDRRTAVDRRVLV